MPDGGHLRIGLDVATVTDDAMPNGPETTNSAALGVTHLLAKPFSREDLVTAVEQVLGRGQA